MQVIFESRDVQAQPLRELSEARVRFALRRWRAWVPSARVQLSDVNGPRGGVDKRCLIELRARGADPVVITSLARDWRTALDLSLGRATHALLRQLRRRQQTTAMRPLTWVVDQ